MLLRDPIHGLLRFYREHGQLMEDLVSTREVQRLRRVTALGLAARVFPGGEHSRFSHSVGAAYVMQSYLARAREFATDLAPADRVDEFTAQIAMAAALLHDLGHGPLSHTFEAVFPESPRHEWWTTQIVLDPSTEVHQVLRARDEAMPGQVAALLRGQFDVPHVARAVSGTFDVDRCDYLLRDAYMTGVRYGNFDLDWLLASLRFYTPAGERAVLAVDGEKGLTAVESFFLARLFMYRQVYLHKAVRAAEFGLRCLVRRLQQVGPPDHADLRWRRLLAGQTLDCVDYLELDDGALWSFIAACERHRDSLTAELAAGVRHRRLFKTFTLRTPAPPAAGLLLQDVARAHDLPADDLVTIDQAHVSAYDDQEQLYVLRGSHVEPLLDVSPVLRGLTRETYGYTRAIFPRSIRNEVERALAPFA